MDIKAAYKIMKLSPPISLTVLKHAYHKQALLHHPDRLSEDKKLEGKEKFQEIGLAYEVLSVHIGENINVKNNYFDVDIDDTSYESILKNFIAETFGSRSDIVETVIKKITSKCAIFSKKMLDTIDKKTLLKIYDYVNKYDDVLAIKKEIKDFLKEYVKDKTKNDCVYNLNPTLSDIMTHTVYQLEVDKKEYYIPLWHEEVQFDEEDKCIIVRCDAELPKHVIIDHNNNIEVNLSVNLDGILDRGNISFKLAEKEFNIPISNLLIKRHQIYVLKNEGIPQIDAEDIYSCDKIGDIIVYINLL